MSEIGINEVLSQLRALATQAQGRPPAMETGGPQAANGFQAMLRNSIESVNQSQQQAASLAKALELGDPNVDLASVMVAMQKSSVSFQAMVQVRNKLVSAYQEVMSMPV